MSGGTRLCHSFVLLFVLIVGVASASAQDGPRLPDAPKLKLPDAPKATAKFPGNDLTGIGAVDPRTTVDQTAMPWRAVGRLKAGGSSCTGALVGPSLLLTAAHCVFNSQSREFFAAEELQFFLGYSEGKFVDQAKGKRVIRPDSYDPILAIGSMGNDWALVELDRPIGTPDRVLPMRTKAPTGGEMVALGGYSKDKIEFLMADLQCRVLGLMSDRSGMPLIRHNCTATHGVSGAPLLIKDGDEWFIGGIEVVASQSSGGAAVLYDVREAMDKMAK